MRDQEGRPGGGAARRQRSREARQRETRDALVVAARARFAHDGFHKARLDAIAEDAGFSKGAVYSNFASKAELFLAVLDANLEAVGEEAFDPFAPPEAHEPVPPEVAEQIEGFGLASLEFIAVAARDPDLSPRLAERIERMLRAYVATARESAGAPDELGADQLGALLLALDQGATMLTLSGARTVDAGLLRVGMRRLLAPARAAAAPPPEPGDQPALHPGELRSRLAAGR